MLMETNCATKIDSGQLSGELFGECKETLKDRDLHLVKLNFKRLLVAFQLVLGSWHCIVYLGQGIMVKRLLV